MKKRYKFLRTGLKSDNGTDRDWKIGEWRSEKDINICNQGFHASKTPLQAFGYVQGEILARVEVKGESIVQDNKECWSDMRIIEAFHWKKEDSVALSIFAAELCIENFEKVYPEDKRPRNAIKAAKKWLAEPTEANRLAAHSAAYSTYSAHSAHSAADSAAHSARSAADSAYSAAHSAAYSAYSAAHSAAYSALVKKLDAWFLKRIKTLEVWTE